MFFQPTTAQRLLRELQAAGHPAISCYGVQTNFHIDFVAGTTPTQVTAAYAFAENTFDWTAAAHTAWLKIQDRAAAGVAYDATDKVGKLHRAELLLLLDEFNAIRQWLAIFMTEVAASTSLADLKTRVATLPAMPDRTAAQIRTALTNKLSTLD